MRRAGKSSHLHFVRDRAISAVWAVIWPFYFFMRAPVKVQLRQALARLVYLVVGHGDRQPEIPFALSAVTGAGCDRYARMVQQVVREGLGGEASRHAGPDVQAGFGLRSMNAY